LGVPYATAYRALFGKACARAAETVLVHGGSGGVGIAALQLAKAAGMKVIATAGTQKGLALLTKQGADHALNHAEAGYFDTIRTLTGGEGVQVVLEMLANVNLSHDLKALSTGGRVVVIGSRGTVTIDPRELMQRDAMVCGMVLFNTDEIELGRIHAALQAGLENGTLAPVIRKKYPLREAAQAHATLMQPGAYGKIVLVP
jgi:NADPH2:quinone reductase